MTLDSAPSAIVGIIPALHSSQHCWKDPCEILHSKFLHNLNIGLAGLEVMSFSFTWSHCDHPYNRRLSGLGWGGMQLGDFSRLAWDKGSNDT